MRAFGLLPAGGFTGRTPLGPFGDGGDLQPQVVVLPRTHTPPVVGPEPLTRAQMGHCQVHWVTSQTFTIANPETGQPFRLDGKPYALNVALCGTFCEWFAPEPGVPVCRLCALVLEARGGVRPQ